MDWYKVTIGVVIFFSVWGFIGIVCCYHALHLVGKGETIPKVSIAHNPIAALRFMITGKWNKKYNSLYW